MLVPVLELDLVLIPLSGAGAVLVLVLLLALLLLGSRTVVAGPKQQQKERHKQDSYHQRKEGHEQRLATRGMMATRLRMRKTRETWGKWHMTQTALGEMTMDTHG